MPATMPARTPPRARETGIFPSYPAGLVPRGRGRRGGFSIGRFVYLGSHPVLALIGLAITVYIWAFILAWLAVVTLAWLACGTPVAVWRLLKRR